MELRTIRSLPRYEKEQTMAKPNENFKLNIRDIELIDSALFLLQSNAKEDKDKREIQNVRAKLHHQKHWYRPKTDYVSG
jgi:hypothetical protein